jgi:tetratricopeptide (TPR) repeat protein
MNDSIKRKLLVFTVLFFAVLLGVALFWFSANKKGQTMAGQKADYIISGVPYFGVHNHTGNNRYISGDSASAMLSILEYWNPGKNNYLEASRGIRGDRATVTGDSIKKYFDQSGYTVKTIYLKNNELKNYINSNLRTPLFAFLSSDKDQSEDNVYHPAIVVIGVKESEGKVIVHDFWLGNNYDISFAEMDQRWSRMRQDERYEYIVAQPQDLKEKLAEIGTRKIEAYPQRTTTMNQNAEMLKNYALGTGESISGNNSKAIDYFLKIEKNPQFEEKLPRYFMAATYTGLATAYLRTKDTESASTYVQKAIDVNHDLDKSFGDWIGYEYSYSKDIVGQSVTPWIVLGDIEIEKKDYQKAKESYEKAGTIAPNYGEVEDRLKVVERAQLQTQSK